MRTLAALYAYGDWAWNRLMPLLAALDDARLDQTVEIGFGSLRATARHIWLAEHAWLQRWRALPIPAQDEGARDSIAQLMQRFAATARERQDFLAELGEAGLERSIRYQNLSGQTFESSYRDMLLHVANHGTHHRAQLLNLLRRAGVAPPWLDFFAQWREPAAPRLLPGAGVTLRRYFSYGDWAQQRLLDACASLRPDQLDETFEIGLGSLRATLLHIRFSEQWWLENWADGPGRPLPELPADTPFERLVAGWLETASERTARLQRLTEEALLQPISAEPRPGERRTFPLGAVLLQLACHGAHHRAQALNMLRRLGSTPPPLDLIVWSRSQEAAP